jgi:short-subunit dehydrogenase
MKTIAGKTVLLTGASRGIGVFIAAALAKEQATVLSVARSQAGLDQICAEINALGGRGIGIPFDLSQAENLPHLIEQVNRLAGPVDILINNAAIEIYRAFQNYSMLDLQTVLTTNLLSAMELSRLVLPQMLNRRSGHIVNIASTAAKKGHPFDSVYSASKAGLLMWSDAIRQELTGTGVEVSVICPGYVSQQGMLANTQVDAPSLAGTSTPAVVANAVVRSIKEDKAEVIVNKDTATELLTKILFAIWQFHPRFGDAMYRWMGIPQLNQVRIEKSVQPEKLQETQEKTRLDSSLKR